MRTGYIICGYARTGSTLLCRALRATGRLGYAQEYFNPRAIDVAEGERYPTDPTEQLAEITRRGMSPNGVYGVKIFADQFDALRGFDWVGALPQPVFIHLERRDALGQALSQVRATQTGQWNGEQEARHPSHYDAAAIHAELARTANYRARWQMFFARNGIAPLWLAYEDVVADLAGTVRHVATMVGVDDLPNPLPELTTLPPQADAISDAWRERFLREEGNLRTLDRLPNGGITARMLGGWRRPKRAR